MTGQQNGTEPEGQTDALAKELEIRVRQQEVIADLGVYALAGAELQPLMDEAVRQVAQTLDMEYCKVLELLPSGDELLLKAGVGWKDGLVGRGTVGTDRNSQAGYTLRSKEPVIVDDLRTESRFNGPSLLVEHGVVSGMSVIIYGREGAYGVLGTHTKKRRPFSRDDVHFIQAVANILGEAVERKRSEERIKAAHDDLEKRIEERTAELRAAYRELEAFSYSVSHDLRAPLRGIDGFSKVLQEEYFADLDVAGKRYVERIRAAAGRMNGLIDDLLDLARLTTAAVHLSKVDLTAMAEGIAEDLRAREPDRRVTIEIQTGMNVDGDEALLRVVLENLLANAWKFTRDAANGTITVGREQASDEQPFYVRDNGVGFDEAHSDRLFVPFQRLHSPLSFEGTGIGLTTVKRVIEKHGGKIWAESRPNMGATFYFTLKKSSS